MENDNRSQPIPLTPRPNEIAARIRELAKTSCVGFSDHAEQRMEERGITDLEAIRVLQTGEISGEIAPGKREGEWKCKIVAPLKGRREVGVVTLLIRNRRLRVKTVEWEDLR
jgi:hypothetical protein